MLPFKIVYLKTNKQKNQTCFLHYIYYYKYLVKEYVDLHPDPAIQNIAITMQFEQIPSIGYKCILLPNKTHGTYFKQQANQQLIMVMIQ